MTAAPHSIRLGSQRARRIYFLAGLILVGLGLLALGITLARQPQSVVIPLPDRSTLTIDAVTYGTATAVLGTGWQRFVHSLPSPLRERSGCRVVSGKSPNHLHIWASNSVPNAPLAVRWAVLVDEQGNESAPFSAMNGPESAAFSTECYPRRAERLRLRLYEGDPGEWRLLGEAEIVNPNDTRLPLWQPAALPATAKFLTLEAILLALERVNTANGAPLQPGPGETFWRARVRLRRNGKPNAQFEPMLSELTDAAGNRYPLIQQQAVPMPAGETEVRFVAPRWGHERALQLSVDLLPQEEDLILPELTVRVADIPVPPSQGELSLDRKVSLYGGEITLSRIFAPGVLFPKAALGVPLVDAARFEIEAGADERGRKVIIGRPRTKTRSGEALGLQELTIPPGARRLSFTFRPTTPPRVQFQAPLPATNP
jgi:hypothetical protein